MDELVIHWNCTVVASRQLYTRFLWAISHRLIIPYETGIDQILQKFAVGGFLFLSGYKLAISKRNEPARAFLTNRFIRIYPLYLIDVILFSFTVYPHITGELPKASNFLIHAVALQSWFPSVYQANYLSIWFVSNLFFCYVAFLFLRRSLPSISQFILAILIILGGIYVAKYSLFLLFDLTAFSSHFDTYFLFFACGMLTSQLRELDSVTGKRLFAVSVFSILCAFSFSGITTFWPHETVLFYILERMLILGFTVPTYLILLRCLRSFYLPQKSARLLKCLSVSSLCVFLFHRPIWTIMSMISPEHSYLQSLFILGLGIPVIFWISFQIQSFYGNQLSLFLQRSR